MSDKTYINMCEKLSLRLLAFSVALQSMACGHFFFHERSALVVTPGGARDPHSDFGFALEHWNDSLIVSSPSVDLIGKVYKCPLEALQNNSLHCNLLDLFNSSTFSRDEMFPNQNFFLGASITATEDYLFTCAPLVTKNISVSGSTSVYEDAIGSCFVYSNDTSTEYSGPEANYISGTYTPKRIEGGTGWNTFADKENGVLMVAKTSVTGDINSLSISNPLGTPNGLPDTDMAKLGHDVFDMGYGITGGKFFSDQTVYAFSKQSERNTGQIAFLEENKNNKDKEAKKLRLVYKGRYGRGSLYMIENNVVGSMFGYTLAAANLNSDSFTDLLVGAPLQSEDINEVEFGAIHIYSGKEKSFFNDGSGILTIFGAKQLGRFGTTIAVSDIDGDSISEVFVSAPYEDKGIVYILSGHELKNTLLSGAQTMQVSEFQHSQKVVRRDLSLLGFSLLTMPDVDGNGFNDLAIGAPDSTSVLLLRSFQTITVNVTSKLVEDKVRVEDNNCTIEVCLNIDYNTKSNNISGYIIANYYINNNKDIIREPSFTHELSKIKEGSNCKDVVIVFGEYENYDYVFTATFKLVNENLESKEFDKSWVQLSTYSNTKCNVAFLRRCDTNCSAQLTAAVVGWNNTIDVYEKGNKAKTVMYNVESPKEETVSIVVKNNGFVPVSQACVLVEITGASVYKLDKCFPNPPQNPKWYECRLPTQFKRHDETTFDIFLNMSRLSNADSALVVTATTYENCNVKVGNMRDSMTINYNFTQAWQKVRLEGKNQELSVTDIEISNEKKEKNENEEQNTLEAVMEYQFTNEGSVTWNRSVAVLEVEKRSFIKKVDTTLKDCNASESETHYTIICPLTILPGIADSKIISQAEMSAKAIGENLSKGRRINVTSQLTIYMDYSLKMRKYYIQKSIVTDIKIKNESTFKNNKLLIGLVAGLLALLLLLIITVVLCKKKFFERKEKKKLNVLRESVRRRSIRLASVKSMSHKSPSSADDEHDIDIEVIEDSPFEEIQINSKDNAMLIEAQAEVHSNEDNKKKEKNEEHEKSA